MMKCCAKKKCSVISVFAVLAAVAALWFVWFGTASLISKELVEARLQQLSTQLAEAGNAHGKDAKLNYGEVEILGWGYNKRAVIHSVSVDIAGKGAGDANKVSVSAGNLSVEADVLSKQRVVLSAADPINVSDNSVPQMVINHAEPFKYIYSESSNNGKKSFQSDIIFPKELTIEEAADAVKTDSPSDESQANAANAKTDTISVSFAEAPSVQFLSTPDDNARSISYNFSGVAVSGENYKTSIASLIGGFSSEKALPEGSFSGKYTLSAADIVLSQDSKDSKPYSVNVDIAFTASEAAATPVADVAPEGAAPQTETPVVKNNATVAKTDVIVNTVTFSAPDFKLSASGNVSAGSDDPLPSGEVNLNIENLQQLLSSEIVPAVARPSLESALEKIAGQPIAGQTALAIPLKREKNGVFFVGKTTFEELTAAILGGVMMGGGQTGTASTTPAVPDTMPPVGTETPPAQPATDTAVKP